MSVSNLEEILKMAIPLFEQYDIQQVAVFGSFARNDNTKKSDVDLLVQFTGTYDLLDLVGLKQELEEALGRKVDLFTFKSLVGSLFGETVLKEAKIIYEKP